MRHVVVFWFVMCALSAGIASSQDEFPYVAYVNSDRATVHSGPGKVHYATDELRRGFKVEVFRHDPGGWCAIRPPTGSFSLVPAELVNDIDNQGIGGIRQDAVDAWVGTELEHERPPMSQVQLQRGELVEILGVRKASFEPGQPARTYYVIAPPAGEFRWIRADSVSRQLPDAALAEQQPASAEQVQTQAPIESNQDEAGGWQPKSMTAANRATAPATATAIAPSASSPAQRKDASPDSSVYSQLDELNIELSLIIANVGSPDDLSKIREAATAIADSDAPLAARSEARQLLDKVEQLESINQRRSAAASEKAPGRLADAEESPAASREQPASLADATATAANPRFDGTGWLKEVHTSREDVPPYALIDRDGNILQFVTPAPGFNVHRYLDKELGVYGQRGFVQHLDKPHLTAQRVMVLDRHRR